MTIRIRFKHDHEVAGWVLHCGAELTLPAREAVILIRAGYAQPVGRTLSKPEPETGEKRNGAAITTG